MQFKAFFKALVELWLLFCAGPRVVTTFAVIPQINVLMKNDDFLELKLQSSEENSFSEALLQLFRAEGVHIKGEVTNL